MALIQDDHYIISGWSSNAFKFARTKLYLAIQGEYKKFGITERFGERVVSYATHNPINPEFVIFYSRNIRHIETYLNRLVKHQKNNKFNLNKEWTDHSYEKVMNMIHKAIDTDVNWQNRGNRFNKYKNNIWRFVGDRSQFNDERFINIPIFKEKYFNGHILFEFTYSNYKIIFSNSDGYDPNSRKHVPHNERDDRVSKYGERISNWDNIKINNYFNVEFYFFERDSSDDIEETEYKILETLKEINISNEFSISDPKLKDIEWKIKPESERSIHYKGIFFKIVSENDYINLDLPFRFMNEFFEEFKISDERFIEEFEHTIEEY